MRKRVLDSNDYMDIQAKLNAHMAMISMLTLTLSDENKHVVAQQLEGLARNYPRRANRVMREAYRKELGSFIRILRRLPEEGVTNAQGT